MNTKSYKEGTEAEQEFIKLRGDNFIRPATRDENIFEHWDVLDKKFGKIDVGVLATSWYVFWPSAASLLFHSLSSSKPPYSKSKQKKLE